MAKIFIPQSPILWEWHLLSGPDASDFLHRICTADVQSLSIHQGTTACFLSPQGRVRSYFHLWKTAEHSFALEFNAGHDEGWKEETYATIDQYTFSEKLELSEPTLNPKWIFFDDSDQVEIPESFPMVPYTMAEIEPGFFVCNHGTRDYGRTWFTLWGRPTHLVPFVDDNFPDSLRIPPELLEQWRIEALRPEIDIELTHNVSPLDVGLIDAISQNKGCYPGQEVIERTISLGSPARRLVLLEGTDAGPEKGALLYNLAEPPQEVGEVTSVTSDTAGFRALAMIRKIHAKDNLEVQFEKDRKGTIIRVSDYH